MENKKHIISLAGDIAAGKGAVSNILIDKLKYTIYRNGEYFRSLAKEMNMSVTEFNDYANAHPEIDKKIEARATEYSLTHDKYIIDARLGWYSVPNSYKVYLKVDKDEAARRALNDENRKSTECFKTLEEQKADSLRRRQLEKDRYLELYNVEIEDMSNYDLIIDTTNKSPEEVAEEIIDKYNIWIQE